MAYKNLCKFIDKLEETGELVKIKTFADPFLEISEITDRISKSHGPALLFEYTGYDFPLLIIAFGFEKRVCLAFGIAKFNDFAEEILTLLKDFSSPKITLPDKLRELPAVWRFQLLSFGFRKYIFTY